MNQNHKWAIFREFRRQNGFRVVQIQLSWVILSSTSVEMERDVIIGTLVSDEEAAT